MRIFSIGICIIFFAFLGACQSQTNLREPLFFKSKGLSLGASKDRVLKKLGKAKFEMNLKKHGHPVCILEYDTVEMDYTPVYEGEDVGILAPQSGVQYRLRKDYKLVFINNRLYSIEDFVNNKYYSIQNQSDFDMILDEIRKQH